MRITTSCVAASVGDVAIRSIWAATVPSRHTWGSVTQTERGSLPWPAPAASERRTEPYKRSARDNSAPAAAMRFVACVAESSAVVAVGSVPACRAAPGVGDGFHAEVVVDRGAQLVHRLGPLGEDRGELGGDRAERVCRAVASVCLRRLVRGLLHGGVQADLESLAGLRTTRRSRSLRTWPTVALDWSATTAPCAASARFEVAS